MKTITCCKVVSNEEFINVLPSHELSFDNVPTKISDYDLNALEAGKKLARETKGSLTALSIGKSSVLDSSKIQKDILSRGANELTLVVDDSLELLDSLETAKAITKAIQEIGEYDLVLFGTGSSDLYAQSVGTQVGAMLNVPTLNNVISIVVKEDNLLEVKRALGNSVETFEVTMPAVLSVSSEINVPSIPSMIEIMKAGKKPVNKLTLDFTDLKSSVEIMEELAPEQQERRKEIIEGDDDEAINALVAFLKKEAL
ncbi:electron transfer flavoprotein subunit alpha [Clostridium novyi B str. ATCC 27606]|uniref:Electron transfer flavoprotein small subunit n=2 Tax=Clostridium TaxID=1485 RepID=A0AA40IT71_CLONO|nr:MULTISPECIES: putative electron transfer flavoprotein FixA [Clostridium]KEI13743.1 electron transfer flavoprotein subunit alpha [Clostridium novyi B str. ATCC 27606]KEI18581.1 electron transfer flavoprotein subunit alpha [Clostridium haemolyticum NCTC 9693]KGN00593.1 electron transfer flavoprotein subunit alpha [Clostridium haemolyticum NCTC 8350]OOB75603.1 electron transfer flavoprotein subunit alpha [Clostridium haemolyticum]CAG7839862.1 Protein FixA [Clostridium haemolyticum]